MPFNVPSSPTLNMTIVLSERGMRPATETKAGLTPSSEADAAATRSVRAWRSCDAGWPIRTGESHAISSWKRQYRGDSELSAAAALEF